jgi:hypothetical protein
MKASQNIPEEFSICLLSLALNLEEILKSTEKTSVTSHSEHLFQYVKKAGIQEGDSPWEVCHRQGGMPLSISVILSLSIDVLSKAKKLVASIVIVYYATNKVSVRLMVQSTRQLQLPLPPE